MARRRSRAAGDARPGAENRGGGLAETHIVVVGNGVDPQKFAPRDSAAMRRRLGLEGKLVLGFTGFVREWHGAEAIFDLLAGDALPQGSISSWSAMDRRARRCSRGRAGSASRAASPSPASCRARRWRIHVRCFDIALAAGSGRLRQSVEAHRVHGIGARDRGAATGTTSASA